MLAAIRRVTLTAAGQTQVLQISLCRPPNLFLLGLRLGLEAADLLLRQRHGVLLLLEGPETELEVGHLPLQLHDPGALGHRGNLRRDG